MSSYYDINLSDPTNTSFTISPGKIDGPGSPEAHTALRLHGRGYVGWGEAVNENFVRLLENFMGATAPINPVAGQLWVSVQLYYRNTTSSTFYKYDIDPDSVNYKTWQPITVLSQASAPAETIGTYWFNTVNGTLNLFDSAYDHTPATWMERTFIADTVAPTAPPVQKVNVFDANLGVAGEWVELAASQGAYVSDSSSPPADDIVGTIRYSPATNTFYIWNGSTWESFTTSWGVGAYTSNSTAAPATDVVGTLRYSPANDTFYIWDGSSWEAFTTGWGVGALVSDSTFPPLGGTVGSLRYSTANGAFYMWDGATWKTIDTTGEVATTKVYTISSVQSNWKNGAYTVNTSKWNETYPTSYYNTMVDISNNSTYRNHPAYTSDPAGWYGAGWSYASTICTRSVFEFTCPQPSRVLIEYTSTAQLQSANNMNMSVHIRVEKLVLGVWTHVVDADDGSWGDVTKSGNIPNGYYSIDATGVGSKTEYKKNFNVIFPGVVAYDLYNQNGTFLIEDFRVIFPPYEANVPHRITINAYMLSTTSGVTMSVLDSAAIFTLIGE